MTEIIFVKSTHHYDSYRDFWRLVELSGFQTIYENELDITKSGVYIVTPMNGNFLEHMVGDINHWRETGDALGGELIRQQQSGMRRRAHIIIWNLERPSGSGTVDGYGQECYKWMDTRIVDEVWVSDASLADETQTRYVILGSHPELGELSEKRDYDFCHMSAIIPRRQTIYDKFDQATIGPNCWPPERDDVLRRSKFALNVHQDNYPFCEPLRFALFAAYGLPIISETLRNSFPYGDSIITFGYHNLVSGLKTALNDDYGQWKDRGDKLHQLLCHDLQFGAMVRRAINVDGQTAIGGWR